MTAFSIRSCEYHMFHSEIKNKKMSLGCTYFNKKDVSTIPSCVNLWVVSHATSLIFLHIIVERIHT